MSDKYVIKNCPACRISPSCCTEWNLLHGEWKDCKDINDCVMKRIIEKCKNVKAINKRNSYVGEYIEFTQYSPLAEEILQLFEIEEQEE